MDTWHYLENPTQRASSASSMCDLFMCVKTVFLIEKPYPDVEKSFIHMALHSVFHVTVLMYLQPRTVFLFYFFSFIHLFFFK